MPSCIYFHAGSRPRREDKHNGPAKMVSRTRTRRLDMMRCTAVRARSTHMVELIDIDIRARSYLVYPPTLRSSDGTCPSK